MLKSVLITGSEGYLGSVLVPFLLNKGFEVTGIDTCFFNEYALIDKNVENKNYRFIKLDVRDINENHLKGTWISRDKWIEKACNNGSTKESAIKMLDSYEKCSNKHNLVRNGCYYYTN